VPRSNSTKCPGSSSHALKSRRNPSSAKKPIRDRFWFSSGASAKRFAGSVRRSNTFQQIVGAEIAQRRFWRRCADLQIGSRCDRYSGNRSGRGGPSLPNSFFPSSAKHRRWRAQRPRDLAAGDRRIVAIAFCLQHQVQRHRAALRDRVLAINGTSVRVQPIDEPDLGRSLWAPT